MARCLFVNSFIFQVLMCLILIDDTSPYEKISLESAKLCRLNDYHEGAVVKLGTSESSAKIIIQNKYFERWSGRYKFSCSFMVKAPPDHGIYAVIQSLNFRKHGNDSCKDYVQFEVPQSTSKLSFRKAEKIQKRFCGKIFASETYLIDYQDLSESDVLKYASISENSFVTKTGWLYVTIHIAKERLESNEKLDIVIAFTSYKHDCKKRENGIQCKECEWIWEGLFMDNIQNCPYTTCLDENFCKELHTKSGIRNVVSSGTGTKVSIGAVATIILLLLLFASCVWMSRRMKLWCFRASPNSQPRLELNSTQRTSRVDENLYGDMLPESTAPSAPPIQEEKDLPPSYSSLFPGKQ